MSGSTSELVRILEEENAALRKKRMDYMTALAVVDMKYSDEDYNEERHTQRLLERGFDDTEVAMVISNPNSPFSSPERTPSSDLSPLSSTDPSPGTSPSSSLPERAKKLQRALSFSDEPTGTSVPDHPDSNTFVPQFEKKMSEAEEMERREAREAEYKAKEALASQRGEALIGFITARPELIKRLQNKDVKRSVWNYVDDFSQEDEPSDQKTLQTIEAMLPYYDFIMANDLQGAGQELRERFQTILGEKDLSTQITDLAYDYIALGKGEGTAFFDKHGLSLLTIFKSVIEPVVEAQNKHASQKFKV